MKKLILMVIVAFTLSACSAGLIQKQEALNDCRGLDGSEYSECMDNA